MGKFKLSVREVLPWLILFFLIVSGVFRWIKFQPAGAVGELDWYTFTVIGRMDGLMFGVAAAYIFRYFPLIWYSVKFWGLAVGLIIVAVDYYLYVLPTVKGMSHVNSAIQEYRQVYHYSILPLGIVFVLPYFNSLKYKNGKGYQFIALTSIISYSLYLLHLPFVSEMKLPQLISSFFIQTDSISFFVLAYMLYWMLSYCLAILTFKFYEHPLTDLRDKFGISAKSSSAI